MKGDTSTSQPLDHDSGVLSHGSSPTSSQSFAHWQYSIQEENIMSQNQQEGLKNSTPQELHLSEIVLAQRGSGADSQQQQINCSLEHNQLLLQQNQSHDEQNASLFSQKSIVQISEQSTAHIPEQDRMWHPDNQHQYSKPQKLDIKQAHPPSCNIQVPFEKIFRLLLPHIDRDRAMQIQKLYYKFRSNEISKGGLLMLVKSLVGSHLFRMVVYKIQAQTARNSQTGAHQIQVPSTTTPVGANVKTPPREPSIGQKKPVDALGTPSPVARKKQKVSGAFLDQSIESLNDVITAVSGVNIREEEEQLLSGPKEESRASEATRRVVQEEEHRLILQKNPLQKKLAKIMSKCGIRNISNEVERCLSLCVEERMRGLINNLIRLSKQRVDIERPRHENITTSDVRRQILCMNQKAKEDWEKKQAEEADELWKLNEAEENGGKDKGEGYSKALKVPDQLYGREVGKMGTTAANVAARVAVGGDDMLSKWTLMVEQARQKRERGMDVTSAAQSGKDVSLKSLSTSGRTLRDHQGATTATSGATRKFGRDSVSLLTKIAWSISIKDVIAVLEREPQMSKSILIYRLYDRVRADSAEEGFLEMKCRANERFV